MDANTTAAEFMAAAEKSGAVAVASVIPAKDGYNLLHYFGVTETSVSETIIAWAVMQDHSVRPVTTHGLWDLELQPHLAVRDPAGGIKGANCSWASEAEWREEMLARDDAAELASAA